MPVTHHVQASMPMGCAAQVALAAPRLEQPEPAQHLALLGSTSAGAAWEAVVQDAHHALPA